MLYIRHLNPKVVNRMLPHAAAFFPHRSVRVIESEGRPPRHERKNYSTLPLIDYAGDYAKCSASLLPYHCDNRYDRHEMSRLGQTKPRRPSQRKGAAWGGGDKQHIVNKGGIEPLLCCDVSLYRAGSSRHIDCVMFIVWEIQLRQQAGEGERGKNKKVKTQKNNKTHRLAHKKSELLVYFSQTFLPSNAELTNSRQAERNSGMTEKSGHHIFTKPHTRRQH